MSRLTALGGSVLVAGVLLLSGAVPTVAGYPEAWEPLVFEVTLAGDVERDDTFAVTHSCRDSETRPECAFIHPSTIVCSGDLLEQEQWGSPPCGARTYRLELKREAGVTIEYGLARWAGSLVGEPARMLGGAVTVPDGGVTLRLGYDYSLGSQPPTLPDTAAAGPSAIVPLGMAVLAMSLLASGRASRRSGGMRRRPPMVAHSRASAVIDK